MHNTQTMIEQVRDLAAQVDLRDRLAMIRAIAALESRPNLAEADEFSGALAVEQKTGLHYPLLFGNTSGMISLPSLAVVMNHDPDQRTLYVRVRAKTRSRPNSDCLCQVGDAPCFYFP